MTTENPGPAFAANDGEDQATPQAAELPQAAYLGRLDDPRDVIELSRRADGMVVINADDLVAKSPAMQATLSIADPDWRFLAGQKVHSALKSIADRARHAAFEHLIRLPGNGDVVLTVGGPGSGKSSFANHLEAAEFIVDAVHAESVLLGNRIQALLDAGRVVQVVLLERAPGEAMVRNVLRALTVNRLVQWDRLASSHFHAREAFRAVQRRFAGNPRVFLEAIDSTALTRCEATTISLDEARDEVRLALDRLADGTDWDWKFGALPAAVLERARRTDRHLAESENRDGRQKAEREL